MKKHLVWIASASTLTTLFAVPVKAQIDRPPQCENYVSYYLLPSGNCMNLSSFTELGSLYGQLEALNREATPITASNLVLYSRNRLVFLGGQLRNQSSRSLWVNSATFSFTRRVEGRSETYATIEVPVVQQIAPGSVGNLDNLVDVRGYPTTTIRLISVDAWE